MAILSFDEPVNRTTASESFGVTAQSGGNSACAGVPAPMRIQACMIFQGRQQVVIVHRGEEYHLRITKSSKLILTK